MKHKLIYFLLLCLITVSLSPASALAASSREISSRHVLAKSEEESDYFLSATEAELLTDTNFTLEVFGLSDEDVSFKSDNPSVASVTEATDNSCTVQGVGVGTTSIVVKIKAKGPLFFMASTATLQCRISVNPPAASIKIKKKKYKLSVGQKKKLGVILRPSITTEIPTYTSSQPEIATISSTGKIYAKAAGAAMITATLQNGRSAKCKVMVSDPVLKGKKKFTAGNNSNSKKKNGITNNPVKQKSSKK